MGFIGTTAAVALGGALIPFARFVLRLAGLLIIAALALAYCSDDDGHHERNPAYANCRVPVLYEPENRVVWVDCRRWEIGLLKGATRFER